MSKTYQDLVEISKTATIEEIQRIIQDEKFADRFNTGALINAPINRFQRARWHNHPRGIEKDGKLNEFVYENEFWNPPVDCPIKLGRCNDVNESMFYCANETLTAVMECRPQAGDYFTIATFKQYSDAVIKKNFIFSIIGLKYLAQIPILKKDFQPLLKKFEKEESLLLDDLLDNLFHSIVKDDQEYLYRLSNAITKIKLFPISELKFKNELLTNVSGLIYPSILRNKRDYNFVFTSEFAHENLYIEGVVTIRILTVNESYLEFEVIRAVFPLRLDNMPYKLKAGIVWQNEKPGNIHKMFLKD